MRQICKDIIDGLAEAAGLAAGTIGNLNMIAVQGVEPTEAEAHALRDASEQYCKLLRSTVRQWLARLPPEA